MSIEPHIEILPPNRSHRESVQMSERAAPVRGRRPSFSGAGARPFAVEAATAPNTGVGTLVPYAVQSPTTMTAPLLAQHLVQEVLPSGLSIEPYDAAARAYGDIFSGVPLPGTTLRFVA